MRPTTRARSLAAVASTIAFLSQLPSAAAVSDPPWFGLAPPLGLGDVHRPVVDVDTLAPSSAPVPAGEGARPELDGARIREHLERIVGFSVDSHRRGDAVWGRVTGFPAATATATWVADQLRDAGLQGVEVQEYPSSEPMWWARSWEARLLADEAFGTGTRDVVLESALPTGGSEIEGGSLTAPLVLVGPIEEPLPEVEVRGKVAVQHLRPAGGAYSERTRTRERARQLMALGAVAVLNVVEQIGNMHVRDFSACNGPCFNLGTADGLFLEEVVRRAASTGSGVPRIRLSLVAETLADLRGHNVVGRLPGRGTGADGIDEKIIVNAHLDGWFDAAGDNGDGLAVLLALARHFAGAADRPERTLLFVASGGHHSTGLNGPANFVRMNPQLTAATVLVLNLEHVAQRLVRSDDWTVEATEQPMSFGISNMAAFLVDLARRGVERYGFRLNPDFRSEVPGDLGGYAPLGVARVQAIHSGPMYHTSGDVLATISTPGLERAARFYAYFIEQVAKASTAELR